MLICMFINYYLNTQSVVKIHSEGDMYMEYINNLDIIKCANICYFNMYVILFLIVDKFTL